MKNEFRKGKGFIKAISLLILSFAILTANFRSDKHSWIESIVITIFSPIQKGVSTLIQSSSDIVHRYFFLIRAVEKLRELEDENQMITFENNRISEELLKYKRLEVLFSVKNSFESYDLLMSNVVGSYTTGWSRMLIIDKGTEDSIIKNVAVITHKGLVGRAVRPMSSYSKVLLITDIRSSVDALIQRSRDRGVVVGTNNGYCEMKYLAVNADVRAGDRIISSGMGGTIQKGLLIGTVSEVSAGKGGLFKNVKIIPSSNMNRLEEVFVVLRPSLPKWKGN